MKYRVYFISRKTNALSNDKECSKIIHIESKAKLDTFLIELLEKKTHRFRRNLIVVKAFCNGDELIARKHFNNYNALRNHIEKQDKSVGWWEGVLTYGT